VRVSNIPIIIFSSFPTKTAAQKVLILYVYEIPRATRAYLEEVGGDGGGEEDGGDLAATTKAR
jgi:hypothetical protein